MGPDQHIPSKGLITQRLRNRIIEYLEFAASFEEQRRYQATVPGEYVPGEVIILWGDSVQEQWMADFAPPVYSEDEVSAIKRFHPVWNRVADAMPPGYPRLDSVLQWDQWRQLADAAAEALKVFALRGRLSEEKEVA